MSFCSGCNGEDEASICKWCHQDKVNRARKRGALKEKERLKEFLTNKINLLEQLDREGYTFENDIRIYKELISELEGRK